jgi:hypothetical protein
MPIIDPFFKSREGQLIAREGAVAIRCVKDENDDQAPLNYLGKDMSFFVK